MIVVIIIIVVIVIVVVVVVVVVVVMITPVVRLNPSERFTAEQSLHHAWIEQKAPRSEKVHRWNRNPRPQPQTFSKLVFIMEFTQYYICLNWLSGALVGVGGSDFIGYR